MKVRLLCTSSTWFFRASLLDLLSLGYLREQNWHERDDRFIFICVVIDCWSLNLSPRLTKKDVLIGFILMAKKNRRKRVSAREFSETK